MRRGKAWLLASALFLALTGLLAFWLNQKEEGASPKAAEVVFPRHMTGEEHQRMQSRRTLPAPPPPATEAFRPTSSGPRDPLLAALPRGEGKMVWVMEANALRHSRIGEQIVKCMQEQPDNWFARVQAETGIDVLADIDRLAASDDVILASGNFEQLRSDSLLKQSRQEAYGEAGQLYTTGDGSSGGSALGVWKQKLLLHGKDAETVKRALDQLEGRGPPEPPLLEEKDTYGEMYGIFPAEALAPLFSPNDKGLAEKLAQAASRVELHVDAMRDIAVVARVEGQDAALVSDLAKSLGGALAAARVKALAEGSSTWASLLELAKVQPGPSGFSFELAVPAETVERELRDCALFRPGSASASQER